MITGDAESELPDFAGADVFPLPFGVTSAADWPGEPIPTDGEGYFGGSPVADVAEILSAGRQPNLPAPSIFRASWPSVSEPCMSPA